MTVVNLDAPNLVLPFGLKGEDKLEGLKWKQQEFRNKFPEVKRLQCTEKEPYFNGRECVGCEGEKGLFNLTDFQCTGCSDGMVYS